MYFSCSFNTLWVRRQETEANHSWLYYQHNPRVSFIEINEKHHLPISNRPNSPNVISTTNMDLRKVIKEKASKHHDFYRYLLDKPSFECSSGDFPKMSHAVSNESNRISVDYKEKHEHFKSTQTGEISVNSEGSLGRKCRQRRRGVYEISSVEDPTVEPIIEFKSVKQLREHYQAMLEKTYKNLSLGSDKECTPEKEKSTELLLPPSSGYCSSSASGASDDEKEKNCFRKDLRRSASSDSAVHSEEDGNNICNWSVKRDCHSPSEGKRIFII